MILRYVSLTFGFAAPLQHLGKAFNRVFFLHIYLSNHRACLLDHLTPSLPVPTEDVVCREFTESTSLDHLVAIPPGMTTVWSGFVISQAKLERYTPKKVVRQLDGGSYILCYRSDRTELVFKSDGIFGRRETENRLNNSKIGTKVFPPSTALRRNSQCLKIPAREGKDYSQATTRLWANRNEQLLM
ncbi:hypothetical protein TNCV_4849621 [Trichonephila clavipes]|nr:hypothetical protein TNCV_4849621 [Trichonephila clavipes]